MFAAIMSVRRPNAIAARAARATGTITEAAGEKVNSDDARGVDLLRTVARRRGSVQMQEPRPRRRGQESSSLR